VVPRFTQALFSLLGATAVSGSCTGPATHIHNPDGHRVFVDGLEVGRPELPFRYYGTTRWDATPADKAGKPDWTLLPSSQAVELPPPASLWLFPLDFPLELAQRALFGRRDTTATISLPATPQDLLVEPEVRPPDLGRITERAMAARMSR
jgi:hypothetical protein